MTVKELDQTEDLEQDPLAIGSQTVRLQPFDLLLRFKGSLDNPEIILEEYTRDVLIGLLNHYSNINVRINWFADGLTVHVPHASTLIVEDDVQAPSEPSGSTEVSE